MYFNSDVLEAFISSTTLFRSLMKCISPMFFNPNVLEAFSNKAILTVSVTIFRDKNYSSSKPGFVFLTKSSKNEVLCVSTKTSPPGGGGNPPGGGVGTRDNSNSYTKT